jgi:hypothetical protein
MEILFGLFKSGLPKEEVLKKIKERTHKYREVKGLLQKLYIQDETTGHFGGIYIFDSKASLEAFQNSDLAKSTGDAYKFVEPPTRRVFNVVLELYKEKEHVT